MLKGKQQKIFNSGKIRNIISEVVIGQEWVAHACNPSYSGSRDQEDHRSKLAQANSWRDPSQKKKSHHRKGLGVWVKV
jgi:hypothetical protein